MAFHHQADDRLVAFENLVGDVVHHQRLQGRVLVGVGVAAIDHDVRAYAGFGQFLLTNGNTHRVVVRFAVTTAQHYVAVGIAFGGDDGHATFLVDAKETVRAGDRLQGVDRHRQAAIGAILEAYRRRQAGGHFAVGLRFGGSRADGRPADQVLQVLRGDRVEGFGSGRQAHFSQITQQLATDVQAVLDLERVVHKRIVDQTFPADGGTRLLEIHAHDQIQTVRNFGSQRLETLGILVRGLDIVDRARPNHHEQAMILAIKNIADHLTTAGNRTQSSIGQRNFTLELCGGDQGLVGGNVQVINR